VEAAATATDDVNKGGCTHPGMEEQGAELPDVRRVHTSDATGDACEQSCCAECPVETSGEACTSKSSLRKSFAFVTPCCLVGQELCAHERVCDFCVGVNGCRFSCPCMRGLESTSYYLLLTCTTSATLCST